MKPTLALSPLKRQALAAAVLVACALPTHADERESLESLRQTTLSLIDALVDQGVLTRAKADALIQAAKDKAAAAVAAAPKAEPPKGDASRTIRVPYVPQTVREQLRNEIKQEILAEARNERWGVPSGLPEWVDRIQLSGDLRVRYQSDQFGEDNAPALGYVNSGFGSQVTRTGDFAQLVSNTTDDRERLRLRARLGLLARVSDEVSAGVRLATGSSSDRVSTNQTLGRNFNKYQLLVDQAWLRYQPLDWLSISGGRIPNPWFNTDLVWDEDLNFEGLAISMKWPDPNARFGPFAAIGAFPLRDDDPPSARSRWLYGAQVGASLQADARTRVRFGVGYYSYQNIEGRSDQDYDLTNGAGFSYGQYEYDLSLRQKGNTLFETNSPLEEASDPGYGPSSVFWGLASKFRPLTVTAAAEFQHFSPYSLMASAEYVLNTGYDRAEIARRTGLALDGRDEGYLVRVSFGHPTVRAWGDWQASLTYRWLGSDAVLDAFTDSDFGLGGTNMQGFVLGFTFGLDRNTTLGFKYISGRSIDTFTALDDGTEFSVDTLQVDLNVRF